MTPHEFIQKWQATHLSERSACQQHFLDLCELLGQPKPAAADPDGAWYTFERGVQKTEGGNGWADVWMRGHFGWEYKGKHKDLAAAYKQLLQYREDLENPPLLVVCDLDRFEVHTNFTGTAKRVHAFDLAGLAEPDNLDVLRRLFTVPESLRPGQTTEAVTAQAAELVGQIADGMRQRGIAAHDAAHFLMKLMFSMFADDIGLLRNKVFTNILKATKNSPAILAGRMAELFKAMSTGGYFGADEVLHFNGGLFADAAVIELRPDEIQKLIDANNRDWSSVEPSVFGTLFERTLDPNKRSQIGAHYTSRADIETLLQPVVMQPLRREWEAVKAQCEALWPKIQKTGRDQARKHTAKASPARKKFDKLLTDFTDRLHEVTILDPACGSGNFLYVALNLLLDLNKEVISYGAQHGITLFPTVKPTQLLGIEINEYAQELASVVIWIGYLQWMHDNGFTPQLDPVLEPFESIRRMDAILDLSDPQNPREPEWPPAEFIVGNPPFLGSQKLRSEMQDEYVLKLFEIWDRRVPNGADICCYWFEKARQQIQNGQARRAGLLATQGIRGGSNREILRKIKGNGDIFFAISDRLWILEGANVHISMIGFDDGTEVDRQLDGSPVVSINTDLSAGIDTSVARPLFSNLSCAFQGPVRVGQFDVSHDEAMRMLNAPNPSGKPNSDVIRPTLNGTDIVKRSRERWVIDFYNLPIGVASLYEAPFETVKRVVKPVRDQNRDASRRDKWWLHGRTGDDFRRAISPLPRYLAMAQTAKYFRWRWYSTVVSPEQTIIAFSRDDDFTFGVLHSRAHEVWALKLGTRLETRPRYTPTTCFETFPFPEPTDAHRAAIAAAARELDTLRNNWLNPPEWTRTEFLEFPASVEGPWKRYIDPASLPAPSSSLPAPSIATARYPRTVPKDEECAGHLKKRTLTNLYNERPTWLDLAHQKLDAAVFAAYDWDTAMSDDDLLAALLALNLAK